MTEPSLRAMTGLGRKVDHIILGALTKGSSPGFLSSLKYPFMAGGKRMRAALVIVSCLSAGGRLQDSLRPAAAIEMIHNYSLVMDDLIDRGRVRRGKPTLRVKAGDSTSLLVAMYYREVLDGILQMSVRRSNVRRIAVEAMMDIIDGERLDLLFEQAGREEPYLESKRIKNPSFSQYLTMIGKKTASLFKAAAEVGGEAARGSSAIVRNLAGFGWNSGLAFQIMDDVLDICGIGTGKEEAKDIVEHKLGNAAVLVALRYMTPRQRTEFLNILRTERVSRVLAQRARLLVTQTPAEAECREIAKAYLRNAKEHLAGLRESKHRRSLELLSDLIVSRKL